MRRWASRTATRRTSCTDQRIIAHGCCPHSFWGCRQSFAQCRITAIMANASMTNETWRCQPCQERVSLWSRPNSFLAVSKLSSIAQRWPSTCTRAGDPASSRTPGREERQFAVGYMASGSASPGSTRWCVPHRHRQLRYRRVRDRPSRATSRLSYPHPPRGDARQRHGGPVRSRLQCRRRLAFLPKSHEVMVGADTEDEPLPALRSACSTSPTP